MYKLRLVPARTSIPFLRFRLMAFALSGFLALASVVLFLTLNLNYGIDFRGGILIEVRTPEVAEIGRMRGALSGLGLGEVALQEFGDPRDVLIRVERQAGDATAQQRAVEMVKKALDREIGTGISYRRVEFVGPKVSDELKEAGTIAVLLAVFCMLVYIWFRFEW